MRVKMILPALTEARSPYWRAIKYSLFPPLGLATLAGYLSDDDEVTIHDEHVESLHLDDEPDLVVIQVYITSAYRSYEIADHYRRRGVHVAMGGLHVTSIPVESAKHADTIFIGPGEDIWPQFLSDFRAGNPRKLYRSTNRTLAGQPRPRRDLIDRSLYLVPNSIVVSRGCPHSCDFCYKDSFFRGGKSFYTQPVDEALAEIHSLRGRHLYFLDDNLFADRRFAEALFEGMKGTGRVWQAAGTVQSVLAPGLMEKAVESGLRSLFVGFETINPSNLAEQSKYHNIKVNYEEAIKRLHDLGVMVNASFVFGLDQDDGDTPKRTVEWAIKQGIETSTFHILTPYPGTELHNRFMQSGRITSSNWDRYDTRHVVYQPKNVSPEKLESEYHQAYRDFYRWTSIVRSACAQGELSERLRHIAYVGGWKKMEPLWNFAIKSKQVRRFKPLLESILGIRTPEPFQSPGADKQPWNTLTEKPI